MANEVKFWLQHDAMFTFSVSRGIFCKHNNTSKRDINFGERSIMALNHSEVCFIWTVAIEICMARLRNSLNESARLTFFFPQRMHF